MQQTFYRGVLHAVLILLGLQVYAPHLENFTQRVPRSTSDNENSDSKQYGERLGVSFLNHDFHHRDLDFDNSATHNTWVPKFLTNKILFGRIQI